MQAILALEAFANVLVLGAKLAVGFATGSAAILSDAMHSVTDLANNGIALVAARMAAAPPDREHPYGHRKFETLAVFVLAVLLVVVAIEICLRALGQRGQPITHSGWALGVMLGVLAVNVALATWESGWARRLDSDLVRADARHTWSDVLTTIAVIAGWQLAAHGHPELDALVALAIAALVFYLAFGLFRRAVPALVDRMAYEPEAIRAVVRRVPGVREIRRVRSRTSGAGIAADVVVSVDAALSTAAAHVVANAIEDALADRLGIQDVTVHVEPSGG